MAWYDDRRHLLTVDVFTEKGWKVIEADADMDKKLMMRRKDLSSDEGAAREPTPPPVRSISIILQGKDGNVKMRALEVYPIKFLS
jgi:hypothetical protein